MSDDVFITSNFAGLLGPFWAVRWYSHERVFHVQIWDRAHARLGTSSCTKEKEDQTRLVKRPNITSGKTSAIQSYPTHLATASRNDYT